MKPGLVLLLAILLSVGAAMGAVCWMTPARASDGDASAKLDALAQRVEALTKKLEAQEKAAASAAPSVAQASAPRASDDDLVDRVMAKLAAKSGGDGTLAMADPKTRGAKAGAGSGKPVDLNAEVGKLMTGLSFEKREAIWKALREAGLIEAAVEAIEEKAKANPGNADLQVLLGSAYLQKLFTVPDGPEKGTWAVKADQAFDSALTIDDHNWPARFSKAVSLSFWPPVFNKQPDAIKNFETLVAQQEQGGQTKPEFAQTYYFLSNLYSGQGKTDQALATVKKGLTAFPDDPQLKANLAKLEGK